MWQLLTCCLLAAMPLLTSCGELFDVDEAGETTSATMKMDRDTVFIMPGDSLRLTVTFSPPEVKDKGVMWLIDQPEIARLCVDTLVAQQPGTAARHRLRDGDVVSHNASGHLRGDRNDPVDS